MLIFVQVVCIVRSKYCCNSSRQPSRQSSWSLWISINASSSKKAICKFKLYLGFHVTCVSTLRVFPRYGCSYRRCTVAFIVDVPICYTSIVVDQFYLEVFSSRNMLYLSFACILSEIFFLIYMQYCPESRNEIQKSWMYVKL